MENALILLATAMTAGLLLHPRLARARMWRATMTPLASIIGSGFLVLGPILDYSYGLYAPLVMAALCLGAWLFGSAVRYNIADIDRRGARRSPGEEALEEIADAALAVAYVISVAYYLNLFGSFGVSLTALDDDYNAKLLTSAILFLILVAGWTRGFSALERMEQIAVGIKLAIIAGLLLGMAVYFFDRASAGALVLNPPVRTGWSAITLAFGLIVTMQGFESSRYLGAEYNARTRIVSMRVAQIISTVIYMVYIGLLSYVFTAGVLELDETAIIDLMQIVAPILPVLLVAAALSALFSAAVADTSGSGGLVEELTRGRCSSRQGYAALVFVGVALTWTADVFQIISYASRAFALYYALQAAIAAVAAWQRPGHRPAALAYIALTVLGLMITVFGTPVE